MFSVSVGSSITDNLYATFVAWPAESSAQMVRVLPSIRVALSATSLKCHWNHPPSAATNPLDGSSNESTISPPTMALESTQTDSRSLSRSVTFTNSVKSSYSFTGSALIVSTSESTYRCSMVGGVPPMPPETWLVHTALWLISSTIVTDIEMAGLSAE